MTCSGPSVPVAQAAASYETVRAAVLSGRWDGQGGLAIIVHRGLAAWIGEMAWDTPPATSPPTMSEPAIGAATPASMPNQLTLDELTRALAGIIVVLATEGTHPYA